MARYKRRNVYDENREMNRIANTAAQGMSYLTKKAYQIMQDTNLRLQHSDRAWTVEDINNEDVKRGTFKQCMDYILNEWRNKRKVKKLELPPKYHTHYHYGRKRYSWFTFVGKKNNQKEISSNKFRPPRYFKNDAEAIRDAIKNYEENKKKK